MKKAFTMMEIIFTIAVIGILSAIAIPKMFANKKDAEITVLKEQLRTIRTGLEAYAGEQLLLEGIKKYPKSLCDPTSDCSGTSHLFKFLSNIDIPHRNLVKSGKNFVFWQAGKEIMIMNDYKITSGYAFSYDLNTGEIKCISKSANGYSSLPCSDLGE